MPFQAFLKCSWEEFSVWYHGKKSNLNMKNILFSLPKDVSKLSLTSVYRILTHHKHHYNHHFHNHQFLHNITTITKFPLSQNFHYHSHHYHNITSITITISQNHHYHKIKKITTITKSQNHCYHKLTKAPLSHYHHYHSHHYHNITSITITIFTKSPLSQYHHCHKQANFFNNQKQKLQRNGEGRQRRRWSIDNYKNMYVKDLCLTT